MFYIVCGWGKLLTYPPLVTVSGDLDIGLNRIGSLITKVKNFIQLLSIDQTF